MKNNFITQRVYKMQVITRNMKEVIGEDEIQYKLIRKRFLNIYWGTSPTNTPHFAYFLPLIKLRDLINEGHNVTVLLADVHSYLDQGISKVDDLENRTQLYETIITKILETLGVKKEEFRIVKGSDYQFDSTYCLDLLKFSSIITVKNAQRASSDVVKKSKNPILSKILYPLLQCLDETYLDADIQLGGNDQRKIFTLSRDYIEKLGYNKCSYLITPLIPALNCKDGKTKMSASIQSSKIEFTDTTEQINKKIKSAYCPVPQNESKIENKNPLLSILKYILFEFFNTIIIGENTFYNYESFETEWISGSIDAKSLKYSVAKYIDIMIQPIRDITHN